MTHTKKFIYFVNIIIIFVFASNIWAKNNSVNFTGNKINAIAIDEVDKSLVWIGTRSGIIQYNRKTEKFLYPKNNIINVLSLSCDPIEKNNIWIASKNGLYKFERNTNNIIQVKFESEVNKVNTTLTADTTLINKKNDSTAVDSKDSTFVYSYFNVQINKITIDSVDNDLIWLATNKGLKNYSRKKNKWFHFSKKEGFSEDLKVNTVIVDKFNPDIVWIGTEKGIYKYNRKNHKVEYVPLENKGKVEIFAIAVDGMYVLFGSSEGVDIYNKTKKTWKLYSDDMRENSPKDRILSIEIDKKRPSYVWFGSQRYGIFGYDKLANLWHEFKNQQKNMRIANIVSDTVDNDKIWAAVNICTGGGVIQYDWSNGGWQITEPLINLLGDLEYRWKDFN